MADIVLDNVTKVYPADGQRQAGSVVALEGVNLSIQREEIVSIVGPSGCGKSTLLSMIAGFEQPSRGRVAVAGRRVTGPGPDRMVVFQTPALFPWLSVMDNIVLGPKKRGVPAAVYREAGDHLLTAMGLRGFEAHYPYQLSGGMRQRVQIARALINEPAVLLMDEPFGALDAQTRLLMQEQLLRVWAEFHPTILFITHDVEEALFLSDRVEVMSARPGRIIEEVLVPFPKPRAVDVLTSPDFVTLKERLLHLIQCEVRRTWEMAR